MPASLFPDPSVAPDTPVEIRGYVTDPKAVGYQILTNYESTYWRALVGNDAWGLYEVLRSFCHEGHRSCRPSIGLLTATLGLKEKRVLTGWTKTLKGKVYHYPGLIEILQQSNLVIADVQGETPKTHYLYHVHLTPGLLSDDQLGQLPAILQKKHGELLARCQKEQEELAAKRRPPKSPGGGGNLPLGVVNYHGGGGNLPPEQHPMNNTHRTNLAAREDHNNSGALPTPSVVVVALTNQGISEKIATRLASHYSQERILEKLTYVEFLLAEQPEKVQSPRGWLRRAIEEDYSAPDGFVTAEERTRRAAKAATTAQRLAAGEQQQQALAAQMAAQKEGWRRQWQARYGTSEADYRLWAEVVESFKYSQPELHDLAGRAQILCCTEEVVHLGFEQEGALHRLDHPGTVAALKRQLKLIAKRPLEIERVLLSVEARGDAGEREVVGRDPPSRKSTHADKQQLGDLAEG